MVNILIDETHPRKVEIQGDLMTVGAEIGHAIGVIHNRLKSCGDSRAAEAFKTIMMVSMMEDSPVWDVAVEGVTIISVQEK